MQFKNPNTGETMTGPMQPPVQPAPVVPPVQQPAPEPAPAPAPAPVDAAPAQNSVPPVAEPVNPEPKPEEPKAAPAAGGNVPPKQPTGTSLTAQNPPANKPPKKPLDKKTLMGIGIALVVGILLIIVGIVGLNQSNTLNLNKYLTITIDGCDGYGTAKAEIDWDAIEAKFGKKVKYTKAVYQIYGEDIEYMMSPMDLLESAVYVSVTPGSGLSNGDVVEYTWNIEKDMLANIKMGKLVWEDGNETVKDLSVPDKFDAFADLDVSFEGISPNGRINLVYTGSELTLSDFSVSKSSNLQLGDSVTVTISGDAVQRCARNTGKVPSTTTKVFTVEGLDAYLTNVTDLTEDSMAEMKAQAKDVFDSYRAKNWKSEEIDLLGFEYIGNYLLTSKEGDASSVRNELTLVYKVTVKNQFTLEDGSESSSQMNEYYWYATFQNLVLASDGTIKVDTTRYTTPNDDYYANFEIDSGIRSSIYSTWNKTWKMKGYEKLEALYDDVVTSKADKYNHADNVVDVPSIIPEAPVEEAPVEETPEQTEEPVEENTEAPVEEAA